MFLSALRLLSRILVRFIADLQIVGRENVPDHGAAVVVSNHLGRLDAMLGVVLTDRPDIVLFVADKYRSSPIWRFFVRRLDAIWLNREELDLKAIRAVQQRLEQGQLLIIAPEGTRSRGGTLLQAKAGAAYLAAKWGLPVIPVGITGTGDGEVKARLRRLQRLQIGIYVGQPFMLPPLARAKKHAQLASRTDEIMCQIANLLPDSYHGVYAGHPRLAELRVHSLEKASS